MSLKKVFHIFLCSIPALGLSVSKFSERHTHLKPRCGFLPVNSLAIPPLAPTASSLTEVDYQDALQKVQTTYDSEFRNDDKKLIIQADWADATVNSYATRDDNDNPVVVAPGGLARYPSMTKDSLQLIFCHEVGHFLGGAPKSPRGQSTLLSWSSAEGEADYFASSRCLKKIFNDDKENEEIVSQFSAGRRQELNRECATSESPNQCMRIVEAGRVASDVFALVTGHSTLPNFSTPDPTVTPQMIYGHPAPQCRLDTFVSGAQCGVSADAKFDDRDPAVGACSDVGARPKCWFVQSS